MISECCRSFISIRIKSKQCQIREKVISKGLTTFTIVNIIQIISDTFHLIEITMFNITNMLEQFIKLEQKSRPNSCAVPFNPLGSRVLEGKGKGQPFTRAQDQWCGDGWG